MGGQLGGVDVDTRAVPARERLEYWYENVRDRFVPLLVSPADREVQGRIRHREIASTKVRRIAGTEHIFRRRDSDIRRGGDPGELNLLFVNRGATVVEQDGRAAVVAAGDVLFYDSARPFEFRTRGPFDYTILLMRKGLLGLPAGTDTVCTVRPGSARDGLAASVRRLVESLVVPEGAGDDPGGDRARQQSVRPESALRESVLRESVLRESALPESVCQQSALQESLLAAVAHLVPGARSTEPPRVPVALVRALIQRHFRDPCLSPASIAGACGISVSYLHRVFAEEEHTVATLIREERLQAALRLLQSPGSRRQSIATIGRRCGLPDPAHFSRVFHRRFGVSPREARDAAGPARTVPPPAAIAW